MVLSWIARDDRERALVLRQLVCGGQHCFESGWVDEASGEPPDVHIFPLDSHHVCLPGQADKTGNSLEESVVVERVGDFHLGLKAVVSARW